MGSDPQTYLAEMDRAQEAAAIRERLPQIVVVGSIIRDGHVLLTQRKDHYKMWPNQWEFPGGKLCRGEKLRDGLARELNEELGLEPTWVADQPFYVTELIGTALPVQTEPYHIVLLNYKVHISPYAQPEKLQVAGLWWVDLSIVTVGSVVAFDPKIPSRLMLPKVPEMVRYLAMNR